MSSSADAIVFDFSKYHENWDNVDHKPEPEAETATDWRDMVYDLPEAPEATEAPKFSLKREKRICDLMEHMENVEEAKRRLDEQNREPFEEPLIFDGEEFLAQDDNPVAYKITDLWPSGGNVLFAAPAKFGKSSAMMNLLRSLLDGDAFLGEFATQRIAADETILLIDLEMNPDRVRSEIRSQKIQNIRQLRLAALRGRIKQFDITDPEVRAYWIDYCQTHNVQTIIVDPLAPILGYLNADENDNTTINRFFQQLDEFKAEAGIRDLIVTHHCGHTADWRPRGASRFNDWPDALWLAKLDGDLDDNPDRKFFVRGRDVGESFTGAGKIEQDPSDVKRLIYRSGNNPARDDTNAQGVISSWVYNAYTQTSQPVERKQIIDWAETAGPDGVILDLKSAKKVDGHLAALERVGSLHGCNWSGRGAPIKYIPTGYECLNPRCARHGQIT